MRIQQFKLERYFARYEFSARYLLCSSDCDGLSQQWLLSQADEQMSKLWENLRLGYTESQGLPLLREEVVKLHAGALPGDVLIVAPEEGIFVTINSLVERGDHVICTYPGYQSLYALAQGLGAEVTFWPADESRGWKFDVEFLAQAIKPNTKLIVLNFPHNPTGYIPPRADFDQILALARARGIYVLSDEMYRLLEFDPGDRLPSACTIYERAISLSGLSKTMGLGGLRMGWLITRDQALYTRLSEFKDYTTICSSAPSEILAVMALRAKDKILGNHLGRVQRNLQRLDGFWARHSDLFDWSRPRAGTICFPRLKIDSGTFEWCETLVKESSVMLLPSTIYDYDDKHFRLGFGRENMPEALAVFERWVDSRFPRRP